MKLNVYEIASIVITGFFIIQVACLIVMGRLSLLYAFQVLILIYACISYGYHVGYKKAKEDKDSNWIYGK